MRTPALLLALALFVLQAQAQTPGILIKAKDTENGQTAVMEIRLGKTHFRTDLTAGGEQFSAIFDGNKQLLVQIRPSRKIYTEMSKAEMDGILSEMLRRAMPNPTPAQQARIEETLRGRSAAPTAAPPAQEFFPFSKDKVGEWPCTNYAPPDRTIICTADPALFGLTAEDFTVLGQLEEFERSLMGGLGAGTPGAGVRSSSPAGNLFVSGISEGKPFAGVVLRRTQSSVPAYSSVFEVTEIRREPLRPDTFEIPAGYTKESMGAFSSPSPLPPVR